MKWSLKQEGPWTRYFMNDIEKLWKIPIALMIIGVFKLFGFKSKIAKDKQSKFIESNGYFKYFLKASGVDKRADHPNKTIDSPETTQKNLRKNQSLQADKLSDKIIEIGFVIAAVALEIVQHLLDVPYLNMGLFVYGEEDVARQRELTKPVMFYVIFVIGEFCGVLLFWKYVKDYKKRRESSQKLKIPLDYRFELMHVVIMSAGEIQAVKNESVVVLWFTWTQQSFLRRKKSEQPKIIDF